jgi:hypothetical protein
MPIGTLSRLAEVLGASVEVTVRWEGEHLDRLIDARHAALQQQVAASLRDLGWLVRAEVSFNHYGDRGRVDVLALHPVLAMLLVVEVKTGIGDVQETLGRLDTKARLGRVLTASVGWNESRGVVPAFVIADARRARRTVAEHEALFRRYPVRGRSALSWLRRPRGPVPSGLLWWVKLPDSHGVTVRRARRVRTVKSGR